jgi:integrase
MSLFKRQQSPNWYIRVEINGREIIRSTGTPYKRQAQQIHDEFVARLRGKATSEDLLRELYRRKSGQDISPIPIGDLTSEWDYLSRPHPLSKEYRQTALNDLQRFVQFVRTQYPKTETLDSITPNIAEAFMKAEEERTLSPKRYNDILMLLRGTFDRLGKKAGIGLNPFREANLTTRNKSTIHRKPFTPQELEAILRAAQNGPPNLQFIYPVLVTMAFTALRKGDACLLNWENVDLENRWITLKTSKTGETVQIPIFPPLLQILSQTPPEKREGYCFPSCAEMYQKSRTSIAYRIKKAIAAGGIDLKPRNSKNRQLPASVYDAHSFRVTWVTLALSAGIPIEIVRLITGHTTVEIVLKHYFNPQRETIRQRFSQAMPFLFQSVNESHYPTNSPLRQIQTILMNSNSSTWENDRKRLLTLLEEFKKLF